MLLNAMAGGGRHDHWKEQIIRWNSSPGPPSRDLRNRLWQKGETCVILLGATRQGIGLSIILLIEEKPDKKERER